MTLFAIRYSVKVWGALCLLALLFFAPVSCSSLDTATTSDTSGAKGDTVPGEVIPNAPDASQTTRTAPGWNW